ncbi:MAG TPA: transglutaminaseTgpA domain-containing protein [Thermoanaerobaculia bacterium]|nr:transglutaminaseTgpA domain-containing protein [Thermoanaerobaculia bacterium]
MTRARELETLLLTMFAALPLYFTQMIGPAPLIVFHVVMAGIALRVASGRGPELIPAVVMRGLAIAYPFFYVIDAGGISRSAIAASTHLVLFISAYQPMESAHKNNYAQRLLTAALLFIASLATATHITIVIFVIVFAFLMFRQMMYVSHVETVQSIGREYALAPASRAAAFYLAGTTLLGAALFPLLPRVRNPVIQGFTGALNAATTGLSDSIDFNQSRTSTPDPTVVARVWMGPQAISFFTPLRLRASVYDSFRQNEWLQTRSQFREIHAHLGLFRIARPIGFSRDARVQQRLIRSSRLFLPSGTHAISGIPQLWEGPTHDAFLTMMGRGEMVTYQVSMAPEIQPLRPQQPRVIPYPVTEPVAALARQIVGSETRVNRQAARIEAYMLQHYTYVQRPEQIGSRPMTTDEFLLRVRRGHCEYFAAGMVALMSTLNVPARIVGGFYGGRMNPLTGYFIIRREDAHAWVEVWEGSHWTTYDPTPASLRPGDAQSSLLNRYVSALNDSINYFWDRYVLTYGLGDQIALLAEMISRLRQAVRDTRHNAAAFGRQLASPRALVTLASIVAALAAAFLLAQRKRPIFDLIAHRLRQLGVEVRSTTTAEEALELLRSRDPDTAKAFEQIIALYEEEQFSRRHDRERIAAIRRHLSELRA